MTPLSQAADGLAAVAQTPARHHPFRWRLHRAGIVNVWYYYDTEFAFSGGRLVLRGTNGSGKSRALEMLLPFLLDADRRKMDATGAGRVRLEDLMRAGGEEQPNRVGHLWLELIRHPDDANGPGHATPPEFLTLGAMVRFARSTGEAKAWYFITPLRVGRDLVLLGADRTPLSRDDLAAAIGADRITDSPETHRERVRAAVFGLTGESGRERFTGLLQLLRTLRSPDVGHRIEEGRLPQILSDALPPPSDAALSRAGEQLDGLLETRTAQQRLEAAHKEVSGFLGSYRRYVAGVLSETAETVHAAATTAEAAERKATEVCDQHRRLTSEHTDAGRRLAQLTDSERELQATVEGIRDSQAYRDVRELDDREKRVTALRKAAASALGTASSARDGEADKVRTADERAAEVTDAAQQVTSSLAEARDLLAQAGVHAALPQVACVREDGDPGSTEVVRLSLDADPAPVTRPVPARITLTPTDLSDAIGQVARAEEAAKRRLAHADARRVQAREIDEQAREVEAADKRASQEEQRLADVRQEAEEEEQALERAAADLREAWRAWIAHETTESLLGEVDWRSTALGPVLDDPGVLVVPGVLDDAGVLVPGDTGEPDETGELLAELDHVASQAAIGVRDKLSRSRALLDAAQQADDERRDQLEAEREALRAARDPEPPRPHWTRPPSADEVPLWRVLDFAAHLDEDQRAGLEGALLASGLLTATITRAGSVVASDGRLLVSPHGPVAAHPLTEALVVDADAPVPVELVRDVLSRISWGDRDHPTWVDADGAWGNGPLTGLHRTAAARHIGAAARAAARAERLAEIDRSLAALADAAAARAARRQELDLDLRALETHIRSAPRSRPVQSRRDALQRALKRVKKAEEASRKAREEAARLRHEWTQAVSSHREACAIFGLPVTVDALDAVRELLRRAEERCGATRRLIGELRHRADLHARAAARTRAARDQRREAEAAAEDQWADWHKEASAVAAMRTGIEAAAHEVHAQLNAAEAELATCRRELTEVGKRIAMLAEQKGTAEAEARAAHERAARERRSLAGAVHRLARRLALPGVAAAADMPPHPDLPPADAEPAAVKSAVQALLTALKRHGPAIDENALIHAQQKAERELSGGFDVIPTVNDGVRLIAIVDGSGERSLPEAAAELSRQCEEGRLALSDRERRVFTEFVLGGVAEELRRRLLQAETLIKAMNASLSGISTSHGIGVRLRWSLAGHAGPTVERIRALVAVADDVRSPEQTKELTDLLKARVDEEFATDPTAGYAAHLRSSLDYRAWHEVEVIITGPEPGRERKISRRAKLSQGETRFVSYVTLFAAVDAYLSGLPDTKKALRLILLDDAFAKVDDPTIGELLGLLVRLDLDFAMTGHALWGFFAQVPALDCYEIRRGEGTAAVTTHIHWDGRNRHLRAAR